VLPVTAGTTYSIQLGNPGGGGADGGDTWFGSSATILAKGGKTSTGTAGGAGGVLGVGNIRNSGGAGGNGTGNVGGGGGSTAGPGGNGNAGAAGSGSIGGAGGAMATGNTSGGGAVGGNNNGDGNTNQTCIACGGGGGGGIGTTNAGYGSPGMAKVTIPSPVNVTIGSPQTICPGIPQAFAALGSGGNSTNYAYKWQYNNTDTTIAGNWVDLTAFSAPTTYLPSTAISITTWYRAIISETSGGCTSYDTSTTVQVFVQQLVADLQFSQTICNGSTPTPLTITTQPSSVVPSFVWYQSLDGSTFSTISGTASSYAPGALTGTEYYMAQVSASGCATYTTNVVSLTTSTVLPTCNPGRNPATMYNTNSLPMFRASVGGSVTTGAWSIVSGGGSLSSTAQTNNPAGITYTAASGYTGTVVLKLTTNPNGCPTQCVSTKTITVLNNTIQLDAYPTPGSAIWTVPGCVNTITVQTWGAGGGGGTGGCTGSNDGSGAGGGAYSASILSVTQGTTYSVYVGAGGNGAVYGSGPGLCEGRKGGNGQNSWFGTPTTVFAQGGIGGVGNAMPGYGNPSPGGQASAGYGNLERRSGGNGESSASSCIWGAGGGGSSAGPGANGNNAPQLTSIPNACNGGALYNNSVPGANAPATEAGAGGRGGYSNGPGTGGNCTSNLPTVGGFPGGGGGGGTNACNSDGRSGGNGQVKILYTTQNPVVLYVSVSPSATICQGGNVNLIGDSDYPVIYSWDDGVTTYTTSAIAVSPAATTTYTLTDLSGCAPPVTQTIVVNPGFALNVTSPIICSGNPGTITASGGASSYVWSNGVSAASITVSPTITTTYTVTGISAQCNLQKTGTITVNPNATIGLTSATGTDGQSVCSNSPIAAITYTIGGGATGAGVIGLPTGVTSAFSGNTFTISGTPTVTGTYNYTVSTTGNCNQVSAVGFIKSNLSATIALNSAAGTNAQTPCINTAITPITYTVGGSGTGANLTGLPAGFTGSYSAGLFTITGTPSTVSNFTYTVTTTGNCTQTSSSGTINVKPDAAITLSVTGTDAQKLCVNTAITPITYSVSGGGTSAGATGLPAGVAGANAGGVFTISGTPSASGTFNYTVTTAGTCNQTTATGTLTVTPLPTATITGDATVCRYASTVISITGGTGTAPYTFTYSVNGTTQTQTANSNGGNTYTLAAITDPAGTYTYSLMSVTDNYTCTKAGSGTAVVVVNPAPGAAINGPATVCQSTTAPLVTFTGSLGTAPYIFSYKINTGATQTVTTTGGQSTVSIPAPTGTVGVYTYSLIGVQDANLSACGAASGGVDIKINSLPSATLAGSITVCQNTASPSLTFTGSNGTAPYTFNYTVNGAAASIIAPISATLLPITTTVAATYTHSITSVSDANGCSSTPASQTTLVRVNPAATATISGSTTVCQNNAAPSIVFTGSNGNAPYTFTYSINNVAQPAISTGVASSTMVAAPTGTAGVYTYSLTSVEDANNAGCSTVTTPLATVTVDSLPLAIAGGSTTICQGTSTTIGNTYSRFGSIQWTAAPSGSGTITNGNTLTPTYAAVAADAGKSVILTMTVTSTNACKNKPETAIATYTVVVDPLPTATINSSTTICQTASTMVSGASSTNGSISWLEDGAGSITTGGNTLTPTYQALTGDAGKLVTLTMTVSSTNTCQTISAKDTAIYKIYVDKLPIATSAKSTTICENGTYTLANGEASMTDANVLNWATANGQGILTNTITLTPTYQAAAADAGNAVVLTLTVASNNTCAASSATDTAIYTIYVDHLPQATVGGATTICENSSYQLQLNEATKNYGNPFWTSNGQGQITNGNTLTPTYTAAAGDANQTVILTMTVTSTNTCRFKPEIATDIYTIVVDSLPGANAGTYPPICENDSITIGSAWARYGSISWTSSGQGVLTNTNTSAPQYKASTSDQNTNVTLTMTVTSTNTCQPIPKVVSTKIFVRPTLLPTMTATQAICQNKPATVVFNVTSVGTSPYIFTYTQAVNGLGATTNTASTSTVLGSSTTTVSVPTGAVGKVVYNLTQVQDANCTKMLPANTQTVIVNPLPHATITKDEDICRDSTAKQLILTGTNGTGSYLFTYNINSGLSGTVQGDSIAHISPMTDKVGTFVYTIINVKDLNNGCELVQNEKVTITVYENPHAIFTISPQRTSILEPEITITDASTAGTSWKWSFGDGNISPSANPEPHSYADTGTYKIKLLVSNALCKDSTSEIVRIILPTALYIPSSFSPNDDGVNDIFKAEGDGIIKFEMQVYDRWGNLVFHSNDINKGWDGKANGGSEASMIDSYVYVVKIRALANKHDYVYRGVISLIK
jgi:gliding motility-associated-like protein